MPPQRIIAAWLVHLYTVSGGIVAMFGLFEAGKGNMRDFLLLLILSRLIDGTDGMLARAARVGEVLPNFSGEMVDNLIDIFTYLWIPVYVMWAQKLVPHDIWLVIPVIATMYSYGQVNMKTEDNFFLGFPSLWGIVMLYLYYLQPIGWIAVLMVLVPGIMSFLPIKFLYFSKNKFLSKPSWIMALVFVVLWVYILMQEPKSRTLVWVSLYFPVYYCLASFYATFKFRDHTILNPVS